MEKLIENIFILMDKNKWKIYNLKLKYGKRKW